MNDDELHASFYRRFLVLLAAVERLARELHESEPQIGDVVAHVDEPTVPGEVVATLPEGRLLVHFPNGSDEVRPSRLVVLHRPGQPPN